MLVFGTNEWPLHTAAGYLSRANLRTVPGGQACGAPKKGAKFKI